MINYLIEFILNFVLGLILIVFLPFLIYFVIKDIRIRKKISSGDFSYLYSTNSLNKTKIILIYLGQILLGAFIIFFLIFIQIPILRDIPSLITGDFLLAEGMITNVENNKSYITIHIDNVEVHESTWFKTTIKPYTKYKISYLKYSKYIIKAEKVD